MKKLLTVLVFAIAILAIGVTFLIPKKPELVSGPISNKEQIRGFWDVYNKATAYRSEKKFEQAILYYEKALLSNPSHEESLYYLGSCLLEIGEDDRAIQTYEKILKHNPRSTRALSQLGMLLSQDSPASRADPQRAEQIFHRVLNVNREESGPYLRLGLLALNQRDWEKGFGYFQTAAGFKSPEGIFFCGYVRYRQERYREASTFFTKVLEINENEKKISGRGVFSEGDVQSSSEAPLSLLEKSGLKALLFLYWSAMKLGSYPSEVPPKFRLNLAAQAPSNLTANVDLRPEGESEPLILPAGIRVEGKVLKVLRSDYDDDGLQDFLVLRWKRPLQMYRGNADRTFSEKSASLNLNALGRNSFAGVFADFDGDTFPDLFLTEHAPYERVLQCLVYPQVRLKQGTPRLLRNKKGTGFEDVTESAGLYHAYGTMDAAAGDINGDGWMDVVLANGGLDPWRLEPSVVLINQEGKRFVEFPVPSLREPMNARSVSIQALPASVKITIRRF